MFSKLTRRLLCLLALLSLFCAPVSAITKDEYSALMRNPDFAKIDKRFNSLWSSVCDLASQPVLTYINQARIEWLEYNLDSRANDFMEDDKLPREKAYVKAANERADDLQTLLNALKTPVKPQKIIGEYVRTWNNVDMGWLTIKWADKKKTKIKLELSAIGGGMANFGTDLWAPNMGEFEETATVKNKVLAFTHEPYDDDFEEAHIIFIFKDDNTVLIETTVKFYQYVGLGVTFDGEYKRKK